jgi:acetyl-CoA carboxylase biotin carboxylase subunit
MMAKIICKGKDRKEAIAKMQRALDEFIVEGIETTVPFHQKLMRDERFREGDFNTGFIKDFDYKS